MGLTHGPRLIYSHSFFLFVNKKGRLEFLKSSQVHNWHLCVQITAFAGELTCYFNDHARLGLNGERKLESLCFLPEATSPNTEDRSMLLKITDSTSPDIPCQGNEGAVSSPLTCLSSQIKISVQSHGLWDSACVVWSQLGSECNGYEAEWHLVWLNVT